MVRKRLIDWFKIARADRIADKLIPFLTDGERVLDFGCGDFLIGPELLKRRRLELTGIDVIDINQTNLPFRRYDGRRLPFSNQAVETVLALFVFHHIKDQCQAIKECLRVASKRLIVAEDVYHNRLERRLLEVLDNSNHCFVSDQMNLPHTFRQTADWIRIIEGLGCRLNTAAAIRPNPWRPSRHRLLVFDL